MTYYATCEEANFDPATGQCAQVVYVQQQTLLPPLSISDGFSIGTAILVCWAIAWGISALCRVIEQQ